MTFSLCESKQSLIIPAVWIGEVSVTHRGNRGSMKHNYLSVVQNYVLHAVSMQHPT